MVNKIVRMMLKKRQSHGTAMPKMMSQMKMKMNLQRNTKLQTAVGSH